MTKRLLALLLSIAMILGLVACGGSESGSQGGNEGNVSQGSQVQPGEEEEKEDGKKPGQSSGGALAEVVGVWTTGSLDDLIFIEEDGSWGNIYSVENKEYVGQAELKNGKLTLSAGEEKFEFTFEDGIWTSDRIQMARVSRMIPKAESVPSSLVGTWKFEERNLWVEIREDVTWYAMDANGAKLYEGYVYLEGDAVALISDQTPPFIFETDANGKLEDINTGMGSMMMVSGVGEGDNVGGVSGDSSGSGSGSSTSSGGYVGVWQYMMEPGRLIDLCVYINSDGSWVSVNSGNDVVAQGRTELNGTQLTMNVDGGANVAWTTVAEGMMAGDNGMMLGRMERIVDSGATVMSELVGNWYAGNAGLVIVVNEDATWYAQDHLGTVTDHGVVSIDHDYDDMAVLLSDAQGYPWMIDLDDYSTTQFYVENVDMYDYDAKRLGDEEEALYSQYMGLWEYPEKGRYILFDYNGVGDAMDAEGNAVRADYRFYHHPETNQLGLMTGGPSVALFEDGKGNFVDRDGNIVLRPATVPCGLDATGIVHCNGVWYHPGQDVYLKIRATSVAYWGETIPGMLVDRDNKYICDVRISYGLSLQYTATMSNGEVWELTWDEDGTLTDGNGTQLVRSYDVNYNTLR